MEKNKLLKTKKKGKVLIVDDQRFMRNLLKKTLEPTGFELIEAADGLDAVDLFIEQRPDLILMDIIMPNLDGIEALKQILKLDKKAKVVICSSLSNHTTANDAIRIGATDFIVKPFDPEKVREVVSKNMK